MLTEEALDFVQLLMDAPIEKIAIENPISVISSRIRKPDQIIQPWMFGENASKKTCLWLKNLPKLVSSEVIPPVGWEVVNEGTAKEAGAVYKKVNGTTFVNRHSLSKLTWGNQTPSGQNKLGPSDDRWKIRSETYQGVAEAFAKQWSKE
jgi:hypothetical protein